MYNCIENAKTYDTIDNEDIFYEALKFIRCFDIEYVADDRLFNFIEFLINKDLLDKCEFSSKFWSSCDVYIYFI